MVATTKTARIAGLFYLSMMTAPFSLLYVPNKLFVRADPTATANNILAHETMFRVSIVNELYIAVMSIFLMMALYRLLSDVNKTQAVLMVILGALVSVPITFIGVVYEIVALIVLRAPEFLAFFNKSQIDALASLFIRAHGQSILVNEIFWGLWLFPLGLLVMRSGFIPRILGILLIVNCFAYLASSLTALLTPAYAGVVNQWALIPETGELWIMLWLLIRGVRVRPLVPATA